MLQINIGAYTRSLGNTLVALSRDTLVVDSICGSVERLVNDHGSRQDHASTITAAIINLGNIKFRFPLVAMSTRTGVLGRTKRV